MWHMPQQAGSAAASFLASNTKNPFLLSYSPRNLHTQKLLCSQTSPAPKNHLHTYSFQSVTTLGMFPILFFIVKYSFILPIALFELGFSLNSPSSSGLWFHLDLLSLFEL